MTGFIINPGTGPVRGGVGEVTRKRADANMRAFLRDLGLTGRVRWYRHGPIESGRYDYRIEYRGKHADVSMPGCALERVRFTGAATENIWNFLRLYVNGNSWIWKYALEVTREDLGLGVPDTFDTEGAGGGGS